ncbi:lipopolysaccharide assembly protein LapA domain-containing protein [Streptomyces sp. NBC_00250]|uniref:lipopolysaccharide assembly protein LapA domain-containing protein n=1 Tax=Streptomyces sp. NBC_00250 TaxID=2903641 RepID=UPI002E2CE281|nr:lipopolysaccharide assembly protein LapA domain-containing protein [Streptomyces sp. NBC_00250]
MSPKETSRTTDGGRSRFTEALTPGRIGMMALAVITLVFIFQNTREVKIRLLIPEVTMPLYLALLATALLGAACGYYAAARRRK